MSSDPRTVTGEDIEILCLVQSAFNSWWNWDQSVLTEERAMDVFEDLRTNSGLKPAARLAVFRAMRLGRADD